MYQSFDKKNLNVLRKQLKEAFSIIEKKLGIKMEMGVMRFSSDQCRTKLNIYAIGNENPEDVVAKASLQNFNGLKYGLNESHLNKPFSYLGKAYKFSGIKSRSRKYPLLGKNYLGKTYKFPANDIILKQIKNL